MLTQVLSKILYSKYSQYILTLFTAWEHLKSFRVMRGAVQRQLETVVLLASFFFSIYNNKIMSQKTWVVLHVVRKRDGISLTLPRHCPNADGGEETAGDDHPAPAAFWRVCDPGGPPASSEPLLPHSRHHSRGFTAAVLQPTNVRRLFTGRICCAETEVARSKIFMPSLPLFKLFWPFRLPGPLNGKKGQGEKQQTGILHKQGTIEHHVPFNL